MRHPTRPAITAIGLIKFHFITLPQRFAPKLQLSRLRTASSDQDRLSEQLVQSLQNGTIDMDTFSSQYREVRRIYYRRALQTEKFEKGQVDWRE